MGHYARDKVQQANHYCEIIPDMKMQVFNHPEGVYFTIKTASLYNIPTLHSYLLKINNLTEKYIYIDLKITLLLLLTRSIEMDCYTQQQPINAELTARGMP